MSNKHKTCFKSKNKSEISYYSGLFIMFLLLTISLCCCLYIGQSWYYTQSQEITPATNVNNEYTYRIGFWTYYEFEHEKKY